MVERFNVNSFFLHFKMPDFGEITKSVQSNLLRTCEHRQIYLTAPFFSNKNTTIFVSFGAALIRNDLFTPEAFISFSCRHPALAHRTPGFSFISLVWRFALFCFNLCFPLFFHQRVQPHGSLCILDLTETRGRSVYHHHRTSSDGVTHDLVCRRLTDECSPCWTFTLSISLERSFSEGRLD